MLAADEPWFRRSSTPSKSWDLDLDVAIRHERRLPQRRDRSALMPLSRHSRADERSRWVRARRWAGVFSTDFAVYWIPAALQPECRVRSERRVISSRSTWQALVQRVLRRARNM